MDYGKHGEAIRAADAAGALKPRVSAVEGDYGLDDAYGVQSAYVAAKSADVPVSGFKGAVTAAAAQQAFGLGEPAVGVLFAPGKLAPGVSKPLVDFNKPMLETEFGYRLNRAVSEPVDDATGLVAAVHLMIELADAGFDGKQTGVDLIAGNVASSHYIEGPEIDASAALDDAAVSLSRDGETLFAGEGRDALGGQMQALTWLINKTVALGRTIGTDDILMTGALGGAAPGATGHYVAQFGDLGSIEFDLT